MSAPGATSPAPADRYRDAVSHGPGAALAKRLGLPRPTPLRRRGDDDDALLVGPALVVSVPLEGSAASAASDASRGEPLAPVLADLLRGAGAEVDAPGGGTTGTSLASDNRSRRGALLLDATRIDTVGDLDDVRAVLAPAVKALAPHGRVVVLSRVPALPGSGGSVMADVERAAAQAGLEGLVRTLAKELRDGATANLVRLTGESADAHAAVGAAASTLLFLASAASAYVSGQVVDVAVGPSSAGERRQAEPSPTGPLDQPADQTLAGRVAVVTGAARGIGAAITAVLAARGAHVVGVDVPAAGDALARVVNAVGGSALALDITADGAGERLARYLVDRHGGAHLVVHNAGITRDKLLVNMDEARWRSVLEVNLAAQLRLTDALLSTDGALTERARVVAVSSTSGLAGNRGQSNYATSKAGVAGMVRALAPALAGRGITVNAVAPGFIETDMTAAMPALTREAARRVSSLRQGGLPVDVAETIAWLADPASGAVTGQVVRVCGQNIVGA